MPLEGKVYLVPTSTFSMNNCFSKPQDGFKAPRTLLNTKLKWVMKILGIGQRSVWVPSRPRSPLAQSWDIGGWDS